VLPNLITDLHAHAASDPVHRCEALAGLLDAYTAATFIAKHLGAPDLATVAAMHACAVAAELESPAHTALAELLRAHAVSSPARARSLTLAARAADRIAPTVGTDMAAAECTECCTSRARLTPRRCANLTSRPTTRPKLPMWLQGSAPGPTSGIRASDWLTMGSAGSPCGGAWRGAKVGELAHGIDPAATKLGASRRAGFYTDLGRGLATERSHRLEAIAALRTAEHLAPQRVRANPFVRETVTDLLRRPRRDAVGRELRGMAYRMDIGIG
jgi:hypothetical protein